MSEEQKVLHQTRQGAVIVEKVGTTYLLLDSIQIKIDVLSFTLVALGARNKDIISDQARCSKCGNSRNYLRSTRINTNKNIDMLSFTWYYGEEQRYYIRPGKIQ